MLKAITCWLALLLGGIASLVFNVEHMQGPNVAKALAGVVPVFMAFGVHLAGLMDRALVRTLAWTAVALAFGISVQSTYLVLTGWGMEPFQAALYPFLPEVIMVIAVLGLEERAKERRRPAAQTVPTPTVRIPSDRQPTVSEPSVPSVERQETVTELTETVRTVKQTVKTVSEKDRPDVERLLTVIEPSDFVRLPEDERVRVVRRELTTDERAVGPDKARRLASVVSDLAKETVR